MTFEEEVSKMTFSIVTAILFGSDFNEKVGVCEYIDTKGATSVMKFDEFYPKLVEDLMKTLANPVGILFPVTVDYNLCEPFKTNQKNISELWRVLSTYFKESSDRSSVYHKIIGEHGISEAEAFRDIISLLFAGHDTTAHSFVSAVYFLKKNPSTYTKVKESLEKEGLTKDSDFNSEEVKELLNNCDYLGYVVKETLRMDPPAFSSAPYNAVQDVEI